ncbi:TAF6-like RNA polymerase II p300/CBP-associated factor-associated factor 65 kDa subunit 6L [Oppia nitens]|uniref:TAF6-like RNA polymerase II p300/CBP-associated factor-associated factor 65 kDa subunit 6L n=1 Tax=Oppia nitens TaxID=1686743 RepID=UPI0023DCDCBC|nr:TAF6-like RNA polymerase II p300/CBP-associated factor-associated factor 65 kDa subunit 6L [Oppia nitens]
MSDKKTITTMSANNQSMKSKKSYHLWPKESIELLSQQMGFDKTLTDDAVNILSSDISFRLRQLVNNSVKHMMHTKSTRLKTSHVKIAIESQHCEQVFGFESTDKPIDMIWINEANVFVYDDSLINLNEEMDKILNKSICETKVFKKDTHLAMDWLSMDSAIITNDGNYSNGIELSDELKQYYKIVMSVVLGTDNHFFIRVLKDLSCNCRLNPVLPYLLNFILNGIKKLSHDVLQLKKFLNTIESLLKNPSVFLATDPYLNVLIQSIVSCIVDPLNPKTDHWSLRDSASHLLFKSLNERFSPFVVNRLQKQTFSYLINCLLDSAKPLSSHYGVIKAFQAFGYDFIVEYLLPILNQYFLYLLPIIDCQSNEPQIRSDGIRVFGELLYIAEVICLKNRSLININFELQFDLNIYTQLSEIFGDALYARLPIDCHRIRHKLFIEKTVTAKQTNLFETQESLQTGEQLLDTFYETVTTLEDKKSNRSLNIDDDNNSCDNSMASDPEKESIVTDVLQVKSTISDPTLGIKLTIKKLRRNDTEPHSYSKLSENSESVFESISLRQTSIRFNISGIKISDVFEKPIKINDYYPSQWFALTMTNRNQYCLRTHYKLRKNIKHSKCLYSCDLFNVL